MTSLGLKYLQLTLLLLTTTPSVQFSLIRADAFAHKVSDMHAGPIFLWPLGLSQADPRLICILIQILRMTHHTERQWSGAWTSKCVLSYFILSSHGTVAALKKIMWKCHDRKYKRWTVPKCVCEQILTRLWLKCAVYMVVGKAPQIVEFWHNCVSYARNYHPLSNTNHHSKSIRAVCS